MPSSGGSKLRLFGKVEIDGAAIQERVDTLIVEAREWRVDYRDLVPSKRGCQREDGSAP